MAEGDHLGPAGAGAPVALPSPRLARAILFAILGSYLLVMPLNVAEAVPHSAGPAVPVLSGAAALMVFGLLLVHCSPWGRRLPVRAKVAALAAQVVLTYAPLTLFGARWGSMGGFLAASLLLVLPPRLGWSLFAAVSASLSVAAALAGQSLLVVLYMGQSSALAGVMVYGVTRLGEAVTALSASRAETARLAVSEERLRFARDLHDLLSYRLSAITLKTELARRLTPSRPERAEAELGAVVELSRQALTDVREVAATYRDLSLADECEAARSILAAARIDSSVTLDLDPAAIDRRVQTTLAIVLREGVTNVVRHARARRCDIALTIDGGTVCLRIANDGADAGRAPGPVGGSGLLNLGERLASVAGTLHTEIAADGRFLLTAIAPK
ncbi:histidine kinase [Actinomadura sp. NPDC049753]|uniref:sensor histidine kinase n=1 Tax=Actinomadura sp. NPDC049753 TaxID=3154739 RepID=UPI0034183A04